MLSCSSTDKALSKFEWPAETETYVQPAPKHPDDMDTSDENFSDVEDDPSYKERNMRSVCNLFPPPLFTSQIAPHKYQSVHSL